MTSGYYSRHFHRTQPYHLRGVPFVREVVIRPVDRLIGGVCTLGLLALVVEQVWRAAA